MLLLLFLLPSVLGAQELWRQLKQDITNQYAAARSNYCATFQGKWPNGNVKVTCEGNIEVIGFPCLDCEHKFDWHDIDSVNRCRQDTACMTSGLSAELVGFDGHVDYVGQKPQMYAGTVYSNHGATDDYQEFTYQKEEQESFTFTVQAGVSVEYSTEVSVNVEVASVKETFSLKFDLSTTQTTQTVKTRSWSATEHISLPGHTQTKVNCYLLSNQYSGHYKVQLKTHGPVLIVVWNKDGRSYHPWYTYYTSDSTVAKIESWYPNGYEYAVTLEGLEGVQVVCDKTTSPLPKLIDFEPFGETNFTSNVI